MAVLTLGPVDSTNYAGSAFISGTSSSGILPIGVPNDLLNTILGDDSDATYFALFGTGAADRSLGVQFASAAELAPSNCTVTQVDVLLRMRNNPATCSENPIAEVWTVWLGGDPGRQITTLSLTSDFADYVVNAPVNPFTGGPWSDLPLAQINGAIFGWRGRTDCSLVTFQIETQWSEAALLVTLELPEPTVTTLPVGYSGAGAAELRGSFNPNQDDPIGPAASFAPARWFFEFGDTPDTLLQVSAAAGEYTGIDTITVSFQKDQLSPLTRYYYRIGVLVDGETFYGDTLNFTTPSTDPSFGAY